MLEVTSRWRRLMPGTAPQRALAVATLLNMTGSGMYLAGSALYFTRIVGLSTTEVGFGLTASGLVGLLTGVWAGRTADRRGALQTYAAAKILGALTMAAFAFVHSYPAFLIVACVNALVAGAGTSSRAPLVRQVGEHEPTRFRAFLRSYANLGIAFGALAAGVAVQIDTPSAYLTLIFCNSASCAICAAVVLVFMPRAARRAASAGARRSWSALRDGRYLGATAINGVMSLQVTLPTYLLPIWIADHTHAPRWIISAILLINTAMVVALQVRVAAGVDDVRKAAVLMRRAGLIFLASCGVFAVTGSVGTWPSLALLLLGIVGYTLGELCQATGSYEIMFQLAPADAQGEYIGVFGLGQGLAQAVSPSVLGLLCLGGGATGWLVLGLILAASGMLAVPQVRAAGPAPDAIREKEPQHV